MKASKDDFALREKMAFRFNRSDRLALLSPKFLWWVIRTMPAIIRDIWMLWKGK